MLRKITKKQFGDLWIEEFMAKDGLCLLCQYNSGVIKTRDGNIYCVCPNGRVKKKIFKKDQ